MRKKKVIVIVVLALLGAGMAVFLLTRDSGPPVVVKGNFSVKDVAQIKSAVRKELWKKAFPNFSIKTFKALPHEVKHLLKTRVTQVSGYVPLHNGTAQALARTSETFDASTSNALNSLARTYFLTNGPNGWSYCRTTTFRE
jgi:hypothetical protein